jgi:hypothetical protein
MGMVLLAVAVPILVLLFALGMERLESLLLPPPPDRLGQDAPVVTAPLARVPPEPDSAPAPARPRSDLALAAPRSRPPDPQVHGVEQHLRHRGPGDDGHLVARKRVVDRFGPAHHLGDAQRVPLGQEHAEPDQDR